MTNSQPSLPVGDNLSSSAKDDSERQSPPVRPQFSHTARPETANAAGEENDSAHSQAHPVPPIRSLTTRRGFHFPSFESLRGHHFSKAHATSHTPIRHQASTELRASLAKLESLLQEAAQLADRVTFHGPEVRAREIVKKNGHIEKLQGHQVEASSREVGESTLKVTDTVPSTARDVTNLTLLDPTIAHPILTLPAFKSAGDVCWKEKPPEKQADIPLSESKVPNSVQDLQAASHPLKPTKSISPQTSLNHGRPAPPHPEIGPRTSSLRRQPPQPVPTVTVNGINVENMDNVEQKDQVEEPLPKVRTGHERHYSDFFGLPSRQVSINLNHSAQVTRCPKIDLRKRSYVDVYNKPTDFDVHQTCNHATIARNWPNSRKRFTALIACTNTGCIGLVLGIYAGEVPAIQYAIADFHHYSILGNVLMYSGMAITGLVLWPLPLLHGRKPYVVAAQLLALVLQVPQGLAVNGWRDPSQPAFRCLLLISRAVSGLAFGLADMNIKATLLDCFGASLQSQRSGNNKHDMYDVRHHGGGMGMWLGFASWSMVGPISVGFMIGASIINSGVSVAWGFWVSFCIIMVVLFINIIMPEARRSAFRRTISELTGEGGEFSRVTRGEIKMHLTSTGPY